MSEFETPTVPYNEIKSAVDQTNTIENPDLGIFLKLSGAKVKLNSMEEILGVIENINLMLRNESITNIRAWVHRLKNFHPKINDKIDELEHFAPISNEVGVTHALHTVDTQSLPLGQWDSERPNPIRRSLEHKMDQRYYDINDSYKELNAALVRNVSTEFYYEGDDISAALRDHSDLAGGNYLGKTSISNDFHVAGDYNFTSALADRLQDDLLDIIVEKVGGAENLIKWLKPVNIEEKANNEPIEVSIEGNDILVDLRGSKKSVIATIINESPITPPEEVKE